MFIKTVFTLKNLINKPQLTPTKVINSISASILARSYSNKENMSKKALIFLAPGYEEIEFVSSVDVLRRAGVEVTIAGLPDGKSPVKSPRNLGIMADISINDAASAGPFDVMILPGGLNGSKTMADSSEVGKLLKDQQSNGRKIAAICAAPTALKAHCIGTGKKVTSYPAVADAMKEGGMYDYKEDDVVVDGDLITSRGPGTAVIFALTILKEIVSYEKAAEVAKGMLVKF